jgi:tellurite resistance protein
MVSWTQPQGPATDAEMTAYIETMMLLAIADGIVKTAELHVVQMAVVSYLESHPTLGDLTREQLVDLCFECAENIYAEGATKRLVQVAKVLPRLEQRMFALGMAVSVAAADQMIVQSEREGLRIIQRAFGLTDDQVQMVMNAFGH